MWSLNGALSVSGSGADRSGVFTVSGGSGRRPRFGSTFLQCAHEYCPAALTGVPGLGLLKLDPLRLSTLEIGKSTAVVTYRLKFIDLDILNLRSLLIKNAT